MLGELTDVPYLPELPDRGPGADLVGRTAANLLPGLDVDVFAARWRLTSKAGVDVRRARSLWSTDLDALEEAADGYAGPVKVQVCGPWTLAAQLELPRGGPVLTDHGACRDVAESLAAGVGEYVTQLRRLPGVSPLVQLDEPALPAVLRGAVPTMSGFSTVAPVEPRPMQEALSQVLRAADAAGGWPLVHCCAAGVPLRLLRDAGARAVALDVSQVSAAADDEVGELVEAGFGLLLGCVPSTDPATDPAVDYVLAPVRQWWSRIGLTRDQLATRTMVTPTCGLAGASPSWARTATALSVRAARTLADR